MKSSYQQFDDKRNFYSKIKSSLKGFALSIIALAYFFWLFLVFFNNTEIFLGIDISKIIEYCSKKLTILIILFVAFLFLSILIAGILKPVIFSSRKNKIIIGCSIFIIYGAYSAIFTDSFVNKIPDCSQFLNNHSLSLGINANDFLTSEVIFSWVFTLSGVIIALISYLSRDE